MLEMPVIGHDVRQEPVELRRIGYQLGVEKAQIPAKSTLPISKTTAVGGMTMGDELAQGRKRG